MKPIERPDVLTDVYGKRAPDAAKFGLGATDHAGIEQATQARRDQKPGQYRNDPDFGEGVVSRRTFVIDEPAARTVINLDTTRKPRNTLPKGTPLGTPRTDALAKLIADYIGEVEKTAKAA